LRLRIEDMCLAEGPYSMNCDRLQHLEMDLESADLNRPWVQVPLRAP
jgi:hypothetical protein